MTALLKRMGRDDLTGHGFRSTFRDWAGEATAYPREVIEHALAHQLKNKAEAAYARGDLFEKRRRLMKEWAFYWQGAGGGDRDGIKQEGQIDQLPTVYLTHTQLDKHVKLNKLSYMTQILYKAQNTILGKVFSNLAQIGIPNCILAGGTALSRYYLHHRVSYDLDFFVGGSFSPENYQSR